MQLIWSNFPMCLHYGPGGRCDTVIYNETYIFSLLAFLAQLLKPLEFPK